MRIDYHPSFDRDRLILLTDKLKHHYRDQHSNQGELSFDSVFSIHEALHSLNEIAIALDNDDHLHELRLFLTRRWSRIQRSTLSYTARPCAEISRFCLTLAKYIDVARNGFYRLLMPTLECFYDSLLTFGSIEDYSLFQLIVADDLRSLIPLSIFDSVNHHSCKLADLCLPYSMSADDASAFKVKLTPAEHKRLSQHNASAKEFIDLCGSLEQANAGSHEDVIEAMRALSQCFKAGSAHDGGGGTNDCASSPAHIGWCVFYEFWCGLSPHRQRAYINIVGITYKFNDIIERLKLPAQFCVFEAAQELDAIIENISRQTLSLLHEQASGVQQLIGKAKGHEVCQLLPECIIRFLNVSSASDISQLWIKWLFPSGLWSEENFSTFFSQCGDQFCDLSIWRVQQDYQDETALNLSLIKQGCLEHNSLLSQCQKKRIISCLEEQFTINYRNYSPLFINLT